jgi:hypothetical protein
MPFTFSLFLPLPPSLPPSLLSLVCISLLLLYI